MRRRGGPAAALAPSSPRSDLVPPAPPQRGQDQPDEPGAQSRLITSSRPIAATRDRAHTHPTRPRLSPRPTPPQYVNKKFSSQYKATIGADFLTKEVQVRYLMTRGVEWEG